MAGRTSHAASWTNESSSTLNWNERVLAALYLGACLNPHCSDFAHSLAAASISLCDYFDNASLLPTRVDHILVPPPSSGISALNPATILPVIGHPHNVPNVQHELPPKQGEICCLFLNFLLLMPSAVYDLALDMIRGRPGFLTGNPGEKEGLAAAGAIPTPEQQISGTGGVHGVPPKAPHCPVWRRLGIDDASAPAHRVPLSSGRSHVSQTAEVTFRLRAIDSTVRFGIFVVRIRTQRCCYNR
mmetsp:Transcript_6510/g.11351  ORF Transcript_6510/g.11351 Transcript_6510/m.11351 type:complete len:243 (+) Transcript_6510:1041-1769(+)